MLLQLALPLANAMAAMGGKPGEIPICTATGIKWIKFDGPPVEERHLKPVHCPLCVLAQNDLPIVETHAGAVLPAFDGEYPQPAEPARCELPASHASSPPARGPPSLS